MPADSLLKQGRGDFGGTIVLCGTAGQPPRSDAAHQPDPLIGATAETER